MFGVRELVLLILAATLLGGIVLVSCTPSETVFVPNPSEEATMTRPGTSAALAERTEAPETVPASKAINLNRQPPDARRHTLPGDANQKYSTPTPTPSATTTKRTTTKKTTTTKKPDFLNTAVLGKGKPSALRIFIDRQMMVVYGVNDDGKEVPIDAFYVSTGIGGSTPVTGESHPIYITAYKAPYLHFTLGGDCWVRYTTHIRGDYFFHSMPYVYRYGEKKPDLASCMTYMFPAIGSYPSSGGCIRMTLRDAALLQSYAYHNMPLYVISESSAYHLPAARPLPSVESWGGGWEPTDWDANSPYVKRAPKTTTTTTTAATTVKKTTTTKKTTKKTTSKTTTTTTTTKTTTKTTTTKKPTTPTTTTPAPTTPAPPITQPTVTAPLPPVTTDVVSGLDRARP